MHNRPVEHAGTVVHGRNQKENTKWYVDAFPDLVSIPFGISLHPVQGDTMQTAIGYVRVSTEGQATEGVSLEAQRARIEAWCLANDVQLGGLFIDAGISGKRQDNRPQLQEALAAVTKSKGVLVVYSLSRLARSTKDTIQISERLDKAGADLVSLSEKLDTTSAAGKLLFRLMAVLAEHERDQISERTSTAMAHKKSKGERVGTIPFGFSLLDDGKTLVRDDREQAIIELLGLFRESGHSFGKIADIMNRKSVPTKKTGAKWQGTTIRNILMAKNST
jgi:DNA invertase Pin-like site-specific DNA recombinase